MGQWKWVVVTAGLLAGCGGPLEGPGAEGFELEAEAPVIETRASALRDEGIVELPGYCRDLDCGAVVVCTPEAESCACCSGTLPDAEDPPPVVDIPWNPGGEDGVGGGGGGGGGGGSTSDVEDCSSPADDDDDGMINCEDPDCFASKVTLESSNLTRHVSQSFGFEATGSAPACGGAVAYSVEWDLGDGRIMTGSQINVRYERPGAYTVTAVVSCPTCDPTLELKAFNVTAWDATIEAPTSKASGDTDGRRANEVVLTGNSVVPLALRAKVTPSSASTVVASRLAWSLVRPSGARVKVGYAFSPALTFPSRGRGVTPTLNFQQLPPKYSDFGEHEILLALVDEGRTVVTRRAPIEIFFDGLAKATLATVPNWFVYYTQIFRDQLPFYERLLLTIEYTPVSLHPDAAGEVPAMVDFQYSGAQNFNRIIIHDLAFSGVDVSSTYCGLLEEPRRLLDLTFTTLVHEHHHVKQIRTCNTYLFANLAPTWSVHPGFASGWSFRRGANSNHYSLGLDAAPGRAGISDNRNTIIDAGGPSATGNVFDLVGPSTRELGRGDDPLLAPSEGDDWCYAPGMIGVGLGPPPAPIPGANLDSIEVAACLAALGPDAPTTPTNLDWAKGSARYAH